MNAVEELLTARQLASVLGVSQHTVLDWFEAGELPGFRLRRGKIGAPVRFRLSEVEAWLEEGRSGPQPVVAVGAATERSTT